MTINHVGIIHHTQILLLMDEILHHLGCRKLCKTCDIYDINWRRISSINSMNIKFPPYHFLIQEIPQKNPTAPFPFALATDSSASLRRENKSSTCVG